MRPIVAATQPKFFSIAILIVKLVQQAFLQKALSQESTLIIDNVKYSNPRLNSKDTFNSRKLSKMKVLRTYKPTGKKHLKLYSN